MARKNTEHFPVLVINTGPNERLAQSLAGPPDRACAHIKRLADQVPPNSTWQVVMTTDFRRALGE